MGWLQAVHTFLKKGFKTLNLEDLDNIVVCECRTLLTTIFLEVGSKPVKLSAFLILSIKTNEMSFGPFLGLET
jgi:hypothetical protein